MHCNLLRGLSIVSCAAAVTFLAGWSGAATSSMPLEVTRGMARVVATGMPAVPSLPKPFTLPVQPIEAASSNGYLPSSWSVTPRGEFTLALPLEVPPGRAGMAPSIALSYSSASGNGLVGGGWSVSGFSAITRGGRAWEKHATTDGVDFSVRDRFYLDGQELVGVNATPYGGDDAEYRTAADTFVRVRSSSAQAQDPRGPEQFTVELGDGRVRTYMAVEAQQIAFDSDNQAFAHEPVRVSWRVVSEQDASGNTMQYEYEDFAGPGGTHASDYWYEQRPSKIFYTANLSNGQPTHGLQDLAQRYVKFEYESLPDASLGWVAGVQQRHTSRLKTIRMYAPNPSATAEVWSYTFDYTVGGNQRSLLSSVQRCESVGGCLWAKQFKYSQGAGVLFQSQPLIPSAILPAHYNLGLPAAPEGEVPAMQVLDLNGDGASDVVFGEGATELWEHKHYAPPYDVWLPDGKFLGGSHSAWISQRDANGAIVPLSQGLSLDRGETPLASAKYGHVRLDEATGVDLDGDGADELVAAIDNLGAYEINVDPNLPPFYRCSYADLKWTGLGFVRQQSVPCTVLGTTNGFFNYYLPNEFPTFADFNGDGLVDRAAPYNAGGWIGSNNPNDPVQFEFSPAWQVALNTAGSPGQFAPAVKYDKWEASAGVVTDLNGDGRPELTSEALKSSLTFDDNGQWSQQSPDSVHLPTTAFGALDGYREFGDFNGDGLEDLLRLTRTDAASPGLLTGQIYWNTGQGFYPDSHIHTMPVDVHPDSTKTLTTRFANPGIRVTDVNSDGRADAVIFNNDHTSANSQPAPRIVFLFSQGDGTFAQIDMPVAAGTRNDVKYWLDNALRPIQYYPDRLENDVVRRGIQALGQVVPGSDVLLKLVPYQDYVVAADDDKTPGLAAGWNLATLADTNADGFIDIVRHVGGNDASGGIEVLRQTPQWGDELIAVTDEATAWPALSVTYSSEWSDRPEVNDSYQCAYPLQCPKSGLRVVREVTSRVGLTDLKAGEDPLQRGRTWQYSYRDPIVHMQGLGFLGFSEVRVWDTESSHPVETITTFDLRTSDASGKYYPGVGAPSTVTIARPILQPGQSKPGSAPAHLTKTTYDYELRLLHGGATHAVFPQSTHVRQWEESVLIAWSGSGPDHLHVHNYAEPAQPPIQVDTQRTTDGFGNVTETTTQTVKGLLTSVSTPTINDTVNWQLGLVSERSVMTRESQKNAIPVWHTTNYAYTNKGQLETISIEPNNPDPTIPATVTLSYDDYGLLTSTTTTVANEVPRARHLEYTQAWPGAPDEHMYASVFWTEHDNPGCVVDCRPAAWILTHPAYGLPVATMDRNGVETVSTYDGHGRPVSTKIDGELPVSVTYSGRADAFGGMNGIEVLTSSGLQQVLRTFNARGATLLRSLGGFDGQWINTFFRYDELGRRIATSRPNAGSANAWTSHAYDSLGRVVETIYPDGSGSTSTFSLLGSEHIDAGGHYSYHSYDVDGRLITSGAQIPPAPGCGLCLAQDVKTTYQYSATSIGAVAIAVDDQGHATQTQYDRRDRPVQQDDPSRGTTKATYNGFGETKQTVHVASGQTETHTYDDLGRVVTTTSADGLTTYSWDTAANGIGRLARAMSPDQIKAEYRYDSLGRATGIDQTDELNSTASVDFEYEPQTGQLASIDYPKAPGQGARFRVAYDYNGYGYLKTVSDATPNQPALVLQQITARNADLALVDAARGVAVGAAGGVIADHRDYDPLTGRLWTISATHAGANRLTVSYNYDADGLVKQRTTTDEEVQIDETFEHDALHRLTHSTRNGMPLHSGVPFSTSLDETYDSVGNRIDTMRNGQLLEHRSYGHNGLQPYTLTERSVSDPANPNQPPQVLHYEYDNLGRLQQDPSRSLTWTAFDLPKSVIEAGQKWTFLYGPANERVKKSGPNGTITYLAGLYEKHDDGHTREHVFHVIGSDEPVADVTYTEATNPTLSGTTSVRYPLTDALGSTNAVADAQGTVAEHTYYDSWGLRSNPDGTPLADLPLFHSLSRAGFTLHEHDDDLRLINMQGRLYDPTLGRFLSPDPLVGNPAFSQSWNAYSYVLNSPLNFTDPSGLECTAGMAVASASEKSFIASGQCTASNNATLPNGDEVTISDPSRVPDIGSLVSSAITFMHDQQRTLEVVRPAPEGTKAADGTQISIKDAITKLRAMPGPLTHPDDAKAASWIDNKVGDFTVRLFCGGKCATASAPRTPQEAAQAPKQLSDPQIARNAVSQVLAAKSVLKFVYKVGALIDGGVDGIIDRLTPEPLGAVDPYRTDAERSERAYEIARRLRQSSEVRYLISVYIWARDSLATGKKKAPKNFEIVRGALFDAINAVIDAYDLEHEATKSTSPGEDDLPPTDPSPDYRKW